jgi:hypothetical protein
MIKHNQDGAVNGLAISLGFAVVFLIAALGFAGWAFTSRQDYKDNSDVKSAEAVKAAVSQESTAKDKEFAEQNKNPLKSWSGPDAYGSLRLQYPKTWSGYVTTNTGINGSGTAVDAYFAPDVVPSVSDQTSIFALRVQVLGATYAQILQGLNGQQQTGLQISAYSLPKMPKVVGVRAVGQLNQQKKVDMVVLPLRSQTIEIWTEGDLYGADFNNYILKNFSFSP